MLIKLANPAVNGSYLCMQAIHAISALEMKAASLKKQLKTLPTGDPKSPERVRSEFATNLLRRLLGTF